MFVRVWMSPVLPFLSAAAVADSSALAPRRRRPPPSLSLPLSRFLRRLNRQDVARKAAEEARGAGAGAGASQ